ncbi:MAG TPA: DMT family transporter [Thermohalobaculum sp.]|nr:DMT family transporter [Thermohalobaculum sp.]
MQTTPETSAPRAFLPWLVLIVIGLAWGSTGPFSKLAVSTGNHPIGVTFWNTAIAALVLTAALFATGRRLPVTRRHIGFFLVCGLLGTALPNTLSYTAYRHLPIGIMVMVISLVPMATLIIALPLRIERPEPLRLAGVALGTAALLMITLPDSSLPDPALAVWVLLPVIVTLSYAAENIYIAAARPPDCDTLAVMSGLSLGALAFLVPMMLAADAWVDISRLGPPEQAILYTSAVHIVAYFGFVWLIANAGPVFAAQVAYLVTGSGVTLGMIFYGERHSAWVWGALVLMFAGLALVKPRR